LSKECLIGTLITVPEPAIIDALALCGFDWLFIDAEHAPLSARDVQIAIQVVADRCATLVRVAENSPTWIKMALDTGCTGVIVPQVNTAADALRAVEASRYPQLGSRSVGISRAHGYGSTFAEYVATANDEVCVIIQAEHHLAVANIEEILKVVGIDAVFVGPYDLSGSLGVLGAVSDEVVGKAVKRVVEGSKAAGITCGIYTGSMAQAIKRSEEGFSLLAVGGDVGHLMSAASSMLSEWRQAPQERLA